jgi:hypothetical protein
MRYTLGNLKKLEAILEEIDYVVRYEKGNFQSGYCLVEARKIAVVNRFFDTEARINCLLDILSGLDYDQESLTEKSRELLENWKQAQED